MWEMGEVRDVRDVGDLHSDDEDTVSESYKGGVEALLMCEVSSWSNALAVWVERASGQKL